MTTRVTGRWSARFAGGALLAFAVLAPGCGRPPDEAWLRFVGFKQGGATISVVKDSLREETTTTVDVELQNGSLIVGQKTGTGILVNRARVDYRMPGFSPPSAEYPLNLYLAPPADDKATTGTLSAFPLAPSSLKQWLIDTGAFDDANSEPVVELTAHVTFFGESDDGLKVETEGGIGIALTNGAKTTVNVFKTRDASKPATSGVFTVFRTGGVVADLPVAYTISGSAIAGTDYTISPSATSVVIPAGADSAVVTVIPLSGGTAGNTTVRITLSTSASYTVGTHSSDLMTVFGE
jgi:hypothetical protein